MNEISALQNALNSLKLKDYRVIESKQKKATYILVNDKGISITGNWNYEKINHFIMGYGKAKESTKTKKLYSKSGEYLFTAKFNDTENDGKYINLIDEENESKIYCTLYKNNFPTRDNIFWEHPITEIKPYELANILEVWKNFDFYFKNLNQ